MHSIEYVIDVHIDGDDQHTVDARSIRTVIVECSRAGIEYTTSVNHTSI